MSTNFAQPMLAKYVCECLEIRNNYVTTHWCVPEHSYYVYSLFIQLEWLYIIITIIVVIVIVIIIIIIIIISLFLCPWFCIWIDDN